MLDRWKQESLGKGFRPEKEVAEMHQEKFAQPGGKVLLIQNDPRVCRGRLS